ncbi:response regulator transcription factor [Streptococcus gallolyticus]|uniref:response regulator transcription factor n=1 Tax=Streptococcus hepaticus TaxID=3349163 RepID=UPI001C94BA5F|nr:response regulator transcription factor [Streptococcus gallolyticus]MBY5041198.1 response regulator transcription factor [Streptococcus gallolyticus]
MNIFVLEDSIAQQSIMEKILLEVITSNGLDYDGLEIFGRPSQLLESIVGKGAHQLFFLDLELHSEVEKGIEVAQKIRATDPYAVIVFVTTHSELMPLAFRSQVAALDYIDKDLEMDTFKQRIEEVLLRVSKNLGQTPSEHFLQIDSPNAKFQIPIKDILYLETSPLPHRVVLHTDKERIEFWGKLTDIAAKEPRLIQCHRSYVVNPQNVRHLDKKNRILYFDNGASCIVSRVKLAEMLGALQE